MSLGWEVSDDDIEMALNALGLDSSPAAIDGARDTIEFGAVERAALASTHFDEQCELAQCELKTQLSAVGLHTSTNGST